MSVQDYLRDHGPATAATIGAWLQANGVKAEAARKRLSRALPPVHSFPVPLFPKGTRFMYLQNQRESERFWTALHRDLRTSGSVYGMALDGLLARRGATTAAEFPVISGATVVPIKRQVTADTVLDRLEAARLITQINYGDGPLVLLQQTTLGSADHQGLKSRATVERIILDGMRDWARNIGAASYNQIAVRGEETLKPVQQFRFDLVGPSYLLPLQRSDRRSPGFLVADVFSDGELDEFHVRYFLRKAKALHATLSSATILPILVANEFTPDALRAGHAAGVLMATPKTLFGKRVGEALRTLLTTLNNAAAYASADSPNRLIALIDTLKDIEGRSQNLRGPLFELLAAYLVRRDAVSIDVGVRVRDPKTAEAAEIDILKVLQMASQFVAIECKAREPGGIVEVDEVQHWLRKTSVIQNGLRQNRDREAEVSFEIWTTGDFSAEALNLLIDQKAARTRSRIDWKSGSDVLALATRLRERAISEVLRQHFLNHPLLTITPTLQKRAAPKR